jgi:hypothetical protein
MLSIILPTNHSNIISNTLDSILPACSNLYYDAFSVHTSRYIPWYASMHTSVKALVSTTLYGLNHISQCTANYFFWQFVCIAPIPFQDIPTNSFEYSSKYTLNLSRHIHAIRFNVTHPVDLTCSIEVYLQQPWSSKTQYRIHPDISIRLGSQYNLCIGDTIYWNKRDMGQVVVGR